MNCAPKLIKLGNSSKGGKLKTDFDGNCNDIPDYVRVKGTTDVNHVSRSGNWISKEKYPNPAVTLELMDCHHAVVKECSYDINGNPVSATIPEYDLDSISFTKTGDNVVLDLAFITENNITSYDLQRRDSISSFVTIATFAYDVNAGGAYQVIDVNPPQDTLVYQIVGTPTTGGTIIDAVGTSIPEGPIPGEFSYNNAPA